MTAHAIKGDRERCLEAGMDEYVSKPIDSDKLFDAIEILSPKREIHEAASNLFSCLHALDSMNLDMIFVEPFEETGLGIAIMDRLKKAVNKFN